MSTIPDFTIIGAGILGLSVARELLSQYPDAHIEILEKEAAVGKHASGRNSGVLHSGIYYKEGSLKARVCAEGAREMAEFCRKHQLPLKEYGKVIVPTKQEDDEVIDVLNRRAISNGAKVEIIDEQQLLEIEPNVNVVTGRALYSPHTSVVDSGAILNKLVEMLKEKGVSIHYGVEVKDVDIGKKQIITSTKPRPFNYVVNTAGLYADRIAQMFQSGMDYVMLPFKGLYYDVSENGGLKINGLIYPVPDMGVPFLGVHFTRNVSGKVFVGPTAVPALGRENYSGLKGAKAFEFAPTLYRLAGQYISNKHGFRRYAHEEASRFMKSKFTDAAKLLVPGITTSDLLLSSKVGIRAQLYDKSSKELIHDFVVEGGEHSIHVLNAVSPAFTSAFSFSRFLVNKIKGI